MGDNVNLSVGQGDLQADPLQMAVAYAAIANGGRSSGRTWASGSRTPPAACSRSSRPRPRASWRSGPSYRQAILDGLRSAASEPGGTSTPVFAGLQDPVAGKTGTAEKGAGRADQSWYVALAPTRTPSTWWP